MKQEAASYVYGVHSVLAVLQRRADAVHVVWLDKDRDDERSETVFAAARQNKIPVQRVEKGALQERVGEVNHQGVVAQLKPRAAGDEAQLYAALDVLKPAAFLLVLDGVQDPHNLGACLRTAAAAGVHAVIAPKDRACELTPTVRKVACGAAEMVPFYQVTNLARSLRELKSRGIWCVGLDITGPQSLYQVDLTGPLALVLGAEGHGLRQLTQTTMDFLAHVPMQAEVASLNVSVAAGIALYEALRQRGIA